MVRPWNARPGISFAAALLLVAVTMLPQAASAHSGAGAVVHCGAIVGRPMVQACARDRAKKDGGPRHRFVEQCRLSISWAVRTCVWRAAAVATEVIGQRGERFPRLRAVLD